MIDMHYPNCLCELNKKEFNPAAPACSRLFLNPCEVETWNNPLLTARPSKLTGHSVGR